jgi:hypothetical protein
MVPDSPNDYVCTKFGQNPSKDVDSRVFTWMLRSKNLTLWHWPLTLKINRVPDSPKDYVCTKIGQSPLKDVDSRVFTRMLRSKKHSRINILQWMLTKLGTYLDLKRIWNHIDFRGQRSRSHESLCIIKTHNL